MTPTCSAKPTVASRRRRVWPWVLLTVAIGAILVVVLLPRFSEPPAAAKSAYEQGTTFYKAGQLQEALASLEKARALKINRRELPDWLKNAAQQYTPEAS